MRNTIRFVFAGLIAVLFSAGIYSYFNSSNAVAGPPAYWVTIDADEYDTLAASGAIDGSSTSFELIERFGGLAIVKTDELGSQALSSGMHGAFHKCAGFIRHETLEDARKSIEASLSASTETRLVEYSINNQAAVEPMLAEASEPGIRTMIQNLSALPNRRHDQQGGLDGANMILSRWRQLTAGRTDISVQPYAHLSPSNPDVFLTPQPSIIMTITGTASPNENVVVGGHQDSIRSGSTTGTAPGADDDASGIATMTEMIRVIVEKGFRPQRTIQFMAYAAEEVGLVGSNNIATNYLAQNRNVVGVLQLDMTNFGGTWADIVLITDNTNAAQNQFLRDLGAAYLPNLVIKNDQCGYGCSDHKSWHDRGFPASMPFEAKYSGTSLDGIPRQYNTQIHTGNDTLALSNNNANHALKFAKLGLTFVGELAKGSVETAAPPRTKYDFDGDGKADLSVFRPSNGVWHLLRSRDNYTSLQFGIETDTITPADFDGDGQSDVAVYRAGSWHVLESNGGYRVFQWGLADDIALPGDYDGDGKSDQAVFRPSNGVWYVLNSSGGHSIFQFGLNGDRPITGDFDGDAKADAAVYRDGVWHILGSTQGYYAFQFGIASDVALAGDFDGDGKDDPTVFRNGTWYTLRSTGGASVVQFGLAGDAPVAADYDGDGRADIAIYRGGVWYILKSSDATYRIEQFGIATDKPAPGSFVR